MTDFDRAYYNIEKSRDHASAWGPERRTGPGPWSAFSEDWFRRHKGKLLWALNHPYLKYPMRELIVRQDNLDIGEVIVDIGPNRYSVYRGERTIGTRFFSNQRMSRRLYFSFKPIWWAMHGWDWAIADRMLPALSFGFDTLTVYPDTGIGTYTKDCYYYKNWGPGYTWANARDGTANGANSQSSTTAYMSSIGCAAVTDQWELCSKAVFGFLTSSIGAGSTVDSADLVLKYQSKADSNGFAPDINVYAHTPISQTTFAQNDFKVMYWGSTAWSTAITYANWNGTETFSFNSTGLAAVNKTGITNCGTQNANYVAADSPPTWQSGEYNSTLTGYLVDQTGTSNDPYLYVVYTLGGPDLPLCDSHYRQQGIQ